ncbi:MAG: hypothetical protein D8M59_04650 [Planctomycetes bacterium]|nr:hypothetical protein [Planctomycetota bacterium]
MFIPILGASVYLATVTEARRSAYTLFVFIAAILALLFVFALVALTYGRYRQRARDRALRQRDKTVHIDVWRESGRRQSRSTAAQEPPTDSEPPDEVP